MVNRHNKHKYFNSALCNMVKVIMLVFVVLFVQQESAAAGKKSLDLKKKFTSSVDSFMVSFINMDRGKSQFWRDAAYRSVNDSDSYNGYKALELHVGITDGSIVDRKEEIDALIDYFYGREDTFGIKMLSMCYGLMGGFWLMTEYGKSVTYYEMAGLLADKISSKTLKTYDVLRLSEAYNRMGNYVDAAYYMRQQLEDEYCKNPSVIRFQTEIQLYSIYTHMRVNSLVEYYGRMIEKEGYYLTNLMFESSYLLRKADYLMSTGQAQAAYDECTVRLLQTSELTGAEIDLWRVNLQAAKILTALGRYEEAERHVEKCKKMKYYVRGFKYTRAYSNYHVDLIEAWINYYRNRTERALEILLESNPPQETLNEYEFGTSYYRCLEMIYGKLGDYRKAVKMVEASKNLREKSVALNAEQRSQDLDNMYRSDTTIINQDMMLMRKNHDVTSAQRRIVLWMLSALMLVLAAMLIRLVVIRYRWKESAEKDLRQKEKLEKEIMRQTLQLTEQKNEISKKNQDIIMSQSYARVIQEGVLPDPAELDNEKISGSFVIYKPVDVVSGDFYWFRRFGNYMVVCCADCLGRGVPGAMMTMVGLTLLNDITTSREKFVASQLLEDLDKALLNMMPDIRRSDSMDVSIAVVDLENKRVDVSTANQDFVVCQDGKMKLYSGVRRHVGFASIRDMVEPFADYIFDMKKGDSLYLYTDGVLSLSGGEMGENLTSERFVRMLSECSQIDVRSRSGSVNKALSDWCGCNNPMDDYSIVCIEM